MWLCWKIGWSHGNICGGHEIHHKASTIGPRELSWYPLLDGFQATRAVGHTSAKPFGKLGWFRRRAGERMRVCRPNYQIRWRIIGKGNHSKILGGQHNQLVQCHLRKAVTQFVGSCSVNAPSDDEVPGDGYQGSARSEQTRRWQGNASMRAWRSPSPHMRQPRGYMRSRPQWQ
jgi:hypothetical protein